MGKRPRRKAAERERAVHRYLELRPLVHARLTASVPPELRREFESVTAHQLRALLLLPEDGLSMRKLAAALGVMGATASVLADRLVAQNLAVRTSDPADRRIVRLLPSERGRSLVERCTAEQRRAADDMFDRLSDEQAAALLDVMETLAASPVAGPSCGDPSEPPGDHPAEAPPASAAIVRPTAPARRRRVPVSEEAG